MPPSLPPSHVVNLMTAEGAAALGAQWRGHRRQDRRSARGHQQGSLQDHLPDRAARHGDRTSTTRSGSRSKPRTSARAGAAGLTAFIWYRALLTIPATLPGVDLSQAACRPCSTCWSTTTAEVWVNGEMPRRSGYPSPATIQGLNMPNRVVLGTQVKAGDKFQLAVFAVNGRSRPEREHLVPFGGGRVLSVAEPCRTAPISLGLMAGAF